MFVYSEEGKTLLRIDIFLTLKLTHTHQHSIFTPLFSDLFPLLPLPPQPIPTFLVLSIPPLAPSYSIIEIFSIGLGKHYGRQYCLWLYP